MSRVHKVIVLNKPFKLWDFTIRQMLMLVVSICISLYILSNVPQGLKVGNLPANILCAIVFFCVCLPAVKFTDLKPVAWWRNVLIYKLKLAPSIFIPKPEVGRIYPDPTIQEPKKKSDAYYIGNG
mgnify:CR=1 FL=1